MRYLEINSEIQDEVPWDRMHDVINGSCSVQDRYVRADSGFIEHN